MKKILFVCHGNICRSPSAEAVMNTYVKKAGLENKMQCDSAGIISFHEGENADSRMQKHAQKRGYNLTSISRPLRKSDFDNFEYIIGMDDSNICDIKSIMPIETKAKIMKMTEFCTKEHPDYVPDPYYGGAEGFELVLDLLEDACEGLLKHILNR